MQPIGNYSGLIAERCLSPIRDWVWGILSEIRHITQNERQATSLHRTTYTLRFVTHSTIYYYLYHFFVIVMYFYLIVLIDPSFHSSFPKYLFTSNCIVYIQSTSSYFVLHSLQVQLNRVKSGQE